MHPLQNERKEHIILEELGSTGNKVHSPTPIGSMPSGESSICEKHFLEAQRHHSTPNFIPKWTGTQSSGVKPKQKCIHPKCIQPVCDKLIIIIYSPDTDVYNIGLGLANKISKQYVIQINVPYAEEKQYLHLSNLYPGLSKRS